ncbi:MAG: ABC transporter permease [Oscillospiraceae bacterium]|nr:ABC transporter permease [Oscillospiraceae bacterium]
MRAKKHALPWRLLVVDAILIVLCLACIVAFFIVSGKLRTIHAAKSWRGESEMNFAQIACFLPEDGGMELGEIESFRETLAQKFVDASLTAPKGGSLFSDAASAFGTVTVSTEHGSATVQAVGVEGNYFLFHPFDLYSGSYLSPNDFMQDRVVLDEVTAWQVFGGMDVAGLTVYIGNQPFYVAGVIRRETDFASKAAWDQTAGIFMSYSALSSMAEVKFTCYEIVLPEILSGYGLNLMKESFPIGRGDIVDNSARYKIKNLIQVIRDYGKRSMRLKSILYPYWENAVRMTEDYLALLLLLAVLFGLTPVITLIVFVIIGLRKGGKWAETRIPQAADEAIQRKRRKRWEEQQAEIQKSGKPQRGKRLRR